MFTVECKYCNKVIAVAEAALNMDGLLCLECYKQEVIESMEEMAITEEEN